MSAVDTNPAEGYKGAALGSGVVQRRKEGDVDEEQVVRLVIGWTSREAHLEAKGKPGGEYPSLLFLCLLRHLWIRRVEVLIRC